MGVPLQPQNYYGDAVAVTPNDNADLPLAPARGLMVTSIGGGATLSFITPQGNTLSLTGLTLNAIIPIAAQRVRSTGTLATVVALY